MTTWLTELNEMTCAEDFLHYFGVVFDPAVVEVNRLHILKRFHDYLGPAPPVDRDSYARSLHRAYQDFAHADGRTAKAFRRFNCPAGQREFSVSVADIGRRR